MYLLIFITFISIMMMMMIIIIIMIETTLARVQQTCF